MENREEKINLIKNAFELKQQKRYIEAIAHLEKAYKLDKNSSDNFEILSHIGDLFLLLNKNQEALMRFQEALKCNKSHIYSIQKCFDIYFKMKNFSKALACAQQMCESIKTPQSYLNYLKALIKLEKNQDAIELFNNLDEKIKLDVDVLYIISTIQDLTKKKIMLERIIEIDEGHKEANLDLAKIAFKEKNYQKLTQYCINLEEDNPFALYYLATIEADKKNYYKAIDLYIQAIKQDSDNQEFYMDLAKVYIDISWLDDALLALKKSINISIIKNEKENLDEKYFLSGWILIKTKQYSKAILNLNSIDKNSKYYTEAKILSQAINMDKNNLSKTKSELEKYLKTNENSLILLDTIALVYKELKMPKQAIEIYEKAQKIYPESIYYTLEIIDLLIDIKDYDKAMQIIEVFKNKHKNCAPVYNSLARIYYRLQKLDLALESIKKYIELDKNKAEAYYFQGLILNDLSEFAQAKTSLFNAIKFNPAEAKYYNQMARSYKELGEYTDALLYSKEAIELNPDEINFKKQAYDIAVLLKDENQIKLFENQLKRSKQFINFKR